MPRFEIVSMIAATVVVLALVVGAVYALSRDGNDHISLAGVDMGRLDLAGGKLLEPTTEPPVIASEQAVAIVENANRAHGRQRLRDLAVRETLLARFVNDSSEPRLDILAWVVNLSPVTVPAVTPCPARCIPPFGFGLRPPTTPSPTPLICGYETVHDVVIIDARTGEWLHQAKSTEPVPPGPGGTCAATPTPLILSPTPMHAGIVDPAR